jgi:signal transduction histidine kinase
MQAPLALSVVRGPDFVFELANPAYRQMVGGRDLVGKTFRQAFPEIAADAPVLQMLTRVYESGQGYSAPEYLVPLDRRGNGTLEDCYFCYLCQPIFEPPGTVTAIMTLAMDVTEQVVGHKARAAEMERAARFNEMFVGMLGHDLRNPLSAITTAASLLEVRADSERIAKPVGHIMAGANRMERMISQLLDFTRIRLGRGLPVESARVDLVELLQAIVEELEPTYKRRILVDAVGDVVGFWDRDRMTQLLATLATNACQHGAVGTSPIILLDGSAADRVRIEVRNRGAIAASILPLLFEPLRSLSGRHEKRPGASALGLGLYISQQIVAAHGGVIHVQSSAEQGTRFHIELPRRAPPSSGRSAGGEAARK